MTSKTFFLNLDWTPHPSSTLCRTKFKPPPSVNIICKESSLKGKVPQSLVLLQGEERERGKMRLGFGLGESDKVNLVGVK